MPLRERLGSGEEPLVRRLGRPSAVALSLALALALPGAGLARAAGVATVQIDQPAAESHVAGSVAVVGWAADTEAAGGTGVDQIVLTLDGPLNQGTRLGPATIGVSRPDVASALANPNLATS